MLCFNIESEGKATEKLFFNVQMFIAQPHFSFIQCDERIISTNVNVLKPIKSGPCYDAQVFNRFDLHQFFKLFSQTSSHQ